MKVIRFEADPDLKFSSTGDDRAPGLHLSDVIKTMQFERDKKFDPNKPLDYMLLEQGHTWEEVLAHALQRRWLNANPDHAGHRPDPLFIDGIWMSPDWFVPDDATYGAPLIEEWKATKTSQNKVLEDHQWYWLVQLQSYLYGMSRHLGKRLTKGRFRVWYINGDYTFDSKVSDLNLLRGYVRYDVEFSWRELDENWKRIIQQAKKHGLLEQEPDTVKEDKDTWQSQTKQPAPTAPTRKRSSLRPERSAAGTIPATSRTSRTSLTRRNG